MQEMMALQPPTEEQVKYPEGFWHWLTKPENAKIYAEFDRRAHEMAQRRKRYSARAIVQVIRWHTDLSEHDELFKINNNMIAGMARLWMRDNGAKHPHFFELRRSPGE